MTYANVAFLVFNMLYFLGVHFTVGKRYDADFISWQEAIKRATLRSVLKQSGKRL